MAALTRHGKRTKRQDIVLAVESSPFSPIGSKRTVGGQPVQRFRKELIRIGKFVKDADGLAFKVTPATLEHWAVTFSAMKSAGVKVAVPAGHTVDPEKNRGWVHDIFVDGDILFGDIDLIGEDAIRLAGRTDVSIYSPVSFTDGNDNTYARPIRHVAICSDPVIPGLGEFVAIAASQDKKPVDVPVLIFQNRKGPAMKWDKIKDGLKIESEITDDNAVELVLSAFGQITEKVGELEKKLVDAAKAKPEDKPENKKPDPPDPMFLSMAADNFTMKLDKLVAESRITPAVRDKLRGIYLGQNNEVLALSLTAKSTGEFDKLVAALAENDPVVLGEQTKAQTIALSNSSFDSDSDFDEDVHAEMAAMAGIPAA